MMHVKKIQLTALALCLFLINCPGLYDVKVKDPCAVLHSDCIENPDHFSESGPGSVANCVNLLYECRSLTVLASTEYQICSEQTDQGAGQPCEATTCSRDDSNLVSAIGADCTSNGQAGGMTYTFNTKSPDATQFYLWMRVVRDDDFEPTEGYECTITNVSAPSTSLIFTFTPSGFQLGNYGADCLNASANDNYCWAAVYNAQPVPLKKGVHTISCTCNPNSSGEACGFDGLIFQTSPTYLPDEAMPPTSCDSDATFTAGTCHGNWGPNISPP